MENQKIDLEQVRLRYIAWLEANNRSFRAPRDRFVKSMDWIELDTVVNAEGILRFWEAPDSSRPSAHRILGELFEAGILVKMPEERAMTYTVKCEFFNDCDNPDLS
ncbi:hypothetical protein [Blastopirellula marina]|uniref:Uncharacterized protein n=1 Tax=Blastopirellula marina DSM 3645 TaxID=314230 RepID=A3ZQ08_9BACT|nr:hypothetical protein [Blastopirellula marina]EAQ81281.1 hypothetical protein DSM3645_22856 [Blastopirellula marina DSM 3645]